MAEMNDIVKLAVDLYHGTPEKYSVEESNETLRNALIAANNGSTKLDFRAIRDGKCGELFAIVETILKKTVIEGLQGNEFFMNYVDFRNIGEGDQDKFVIENNDLFVVAKTADGTQGIRRQRLDGYNEVSIPTQMRMIRIYEELNRVLAGRVDFNDMIRRVGDSFQRQILSDIYALWIASTTPADVTGGAPMGTATYFPVAGSYNEETLLTLVEHVEAAAGGQNATLIGTKKALRAAKESIMSDGAKEELHNMGYFGTFYGSACMAIPQRHQVGSTAFELNDKVITVVAGPEKPIKFVYEGDPLIIPGDPLQNADLTQEYVYGQKWGAGLVISGNTGIGCYTMT